MTNDKPSGGEPRGDSLAQFAHTAEGGVSAVLRSVGSLLETLGGINRDSTPTTPPVPERAAAALPAATPPPAMPAPVRTAPIAPTPAPQPTPRFEGTFDDGDDVNLVLSDARERAHQIIEDSVAQAQEMLARRSDPQSALIQQLNASVERLTGGLSTLRGSVDEQFSSVDGRLGTIEASLGGVAERLGGFDERFEGLQRTGTATERRLGTIDERLASLDSTVETIDQRLSRIEATLADLADRPAAPAPSTVGTPAVSVAPAASVPRPAATPPTDSTSTAVAPKAGASAATNQLPVVPRTPGSSTPTKPANPQPTSEPPPVPPADVTPQAVQPTPVVERKAERPLAAKAPPPASLSPPKSQNGTASVPPAQPAEPSPPSERAPEPEAASAPPIAPRPAATLSPAAPAPSEGATTIVADPGTVRFDPAGGSLVVRVFPISGFQGLMRVQDALARVEAVRGATVEAYAQGEARLRIQLGAPAMSDDLAGGLHARLNQIARVRAASVADRSLLIVLE